jgi:hypothetical protein
MYTCLPTASSALFTTMYEFNVESYLLTDTGDNIMRFKTFC